MKQSTIENKLDRIANIYNKLSEVVEKIPIPDEIKRRIISLLLGDKNMQELIDGIKKRRPPRFILIGRTGVGKSSLINAMCCKYLAKESDVEVGTTFGKKYSYRFMGKTIFEVIDTRGIGESLKTNRSSEEDLKDLISNFSPDAILFLVEGRAYVPEDITALKKINDISGLKIPIIGISAQVDKLQESREKNPNNYSERKKMNIEDAEYQFSKILKENDITPLAILPISSYIEWNEDPTKVKKEKYGKLKVIFDGRYNIDKLLDLLENNIDIKAGIFLMLYSRLDQVTRKITTRFNRIFSGISFTIGLTPIPFSDIFLLSGLQAVLIILVAYLGGRDINFKTAKELLVSLGGAGAAGFSFRLLFQQGSKLVNLIYPGAGSFLSAGIAAAGTYAIGKAAISYFIQGVSKDKLKDIVKRAQDEYKREN